MTIALTALFDFEWSNFQTNGAVQRDECSLCCLTSQQLFHHHTWYNLRICWLALVVWKRWRRKRPIQLVNVLSVLLKYSCFLTYPFCACPQTNERVFLEILKLIPTDTSGVNFYPVWSSFICNVRLWSFGPQVATYKPDATLSGRSFEHRKFQFIRESFITIFGKNFRSNKRHSINRCLIWGWWKAKSARKKYIMKVF